jgi:hypothetical protein
MTFEIGLSESGRIGKEKALVRGFIAYDDVFGKAHETEVIYEYVPKSNKLSKLRGHSNYT